MTPGQRRALLELQRIQSLSSGVFTIVREREVGSWLYIDVSLRIGVVERRQGGLDFREREEFEVLIPPDFPFEYPYLRVRHRRFAGFPHVTWSTNLCLYQSKVEWNPSDGLFGFFSRLDLWIKSAARNDMDPIQGPLEPPHGVVDNDHKPFVVRCDAPVASGTRWIGIAELDVHDTRIEIKEWNDLSRPITAGRQPALAVFLAEPLPMEFPRLGRDFLVELDRGGIPRESIVRYLAAAAAIADSDAAVYLILGLPMRRGADGSPRTHIAVWAIEPDRVSSLKSSIEKAADSTELKNLRKEMADLLLSIFELSTIGWCQVLEDRPEIVVRRDAGTPVSWCSGKRIAVLGCGALGSWIAEIAARANASAIHLVDDARVKPGVLARQNYELDDIGSAKATRLAVRISSITGCAVEAHVGDAHLFLMEREATLESYDVIFDCTASTAVQMKLERDWRKLAGRTPLIISLIIDATATSLLGVCVGAAGTGGPWDAYMRLKQRVCMVGNHPRIEKSFYGASANAQLFQPEPGCSDPTFLGSSADILRNVSSAMNAMFAILPEKSCSVGRVFEWDQSGARTETISLTDVDEVIVGEYRVRIGQNVLREAQAWAQQSRRRRSRQDETGGLLWGFWDDAVNIIWVSDASGPPPDSVHNPTQFICGTVGTRDEHDRRIARTYGSLGFVGMWHTHPGMVPHQSPTDMIGMAGLVSRFGQNRKRSAMFIFGDRPAPTLGVYVYESVTATTENDFLSVGSNQIPLSEARR
jgi:hypothetical protein